MFHESKVPGNQFSDKYRAFNKVMSSVRVTMEWMFKEVKLYLPTMVYKRKIKAMEDTLGTFYLPSMVMFNMRNCINPNQIEQYFSCTPPTLEKFLSQEF